ncbi:MAG: hypothetical protein JWN08_1611 [Frankiales bacterium]|nr:hypothetical protein [Frankiales bacterium]
MDAALDRLLAAHDGVVLRWQLLDVVTEGTARGLVRRGVLVVLRHGVYGDGRLLAQTDPTTLALVQVRAESLVRRRDEVATGLTAAAAHGLPFLGRLPVQPRLSLPREVGERPREDRPRSWLPDEEVTSVDGLPVSTIARTVVDVARTRPFAFAVVTADAALARGATRDELAVVLERCRRWPGSRSARRVVEFADALSESALESLGRARFEEAGLPRPELRVELSDADRLVRVDHRWARSRTVAEADGLLKYDSPDVLRKEKLREDWLRDRGEQVVRYVWDEALRRPDVIVDRLRRAFLRSTWRAA